MTRAKIIIGNFYSQILDPPEAIRCASKILRVENDIRDRERNPYMKKYKYLIDNDGMFNTGAVKAVIKHLGANGFDLDITDRRQPCERPSYDEIVEAIELMPFNLRDYQLDALITCLVKKGGIVRAATGAGKGIVIGALLAAWDKNILIPLRSADLMYQLQRELSEYLGIPITEVGIIGDQKAKPKKITVGVVNSLKKPKWKNYLKSVYAVVVDECHNATSNMYSEVFRSCVNARLWYGFSATPIVPKIKSEDGTWKSNNILLTSIFGDVIFRITTMDLINQGWLARPRVTFINNELYFDGSPLPYAKEYSRIIIDGGERDQLAIDILLNEHRDKRVLFFVRYIDHGVNIYNKLLQSGFSEGEVVFANGKGKINKKEKALALYKNGEAQILIGTEQILSEGLNLPCDVAFNMSAGKSEKGIIQRIGRILRKTKTETGDVDPNVEEIVDFYDFCDRGHPYFYGQSSNRIEYLREEGHPINYLNLEEE